MMPLHAIARVPGLLRAAWSADTSSRWSAEVPSRGQCGVTALVIHDAFGGDILKTRVGAAWHFYNRIGGIRLDFTAAQFAEPITYEDQPSSRDEAFADTTEAQYRALSAAFRQALGACSGND